MPSARQVVAAVSERPHIFTPRSALPVKIDFQTDSRNPYELSEEVRYDNGSVHQVMPQGFKWDGASIPAWLPLVPWLGSIVLVHFWSDLVWVQLVLVAYTFRLLPYMQKMGLHARAMALHDALFRTQIDDRLVCDAVMYSVLKYDGVPLDVRWLIYRNVRYFGWIAWRANAKALRAAKAAERTDEVAAEDRTTDEELLQRIEDTATKETETDDQKRKRLWD